MSFTNWLRTGLHVSLPSLADMHDLSLLDIVVFRFVVAFSVNTKAVSIFYRKFVLSDKVFGCHLRYDFDPLNKTLK